MEAHFRTTDETAKEPEKKRAKTYNQYETQKFNRKCLCSEHNGGAEG